MMMNSCLFRIQFADGRVEERPFTNGTFKIGRESGALVLGDPSSSGLHGELTVAGGSVTYTDLGSSNGSFDAHNRRLTGPVSLSPGQSVRLGTSVITFIRPPAPAPGGTALMPQAIALAPTEAMPASSPPVLAVSQVPVSATAGATGPSPHSHPDRQVRHSYPVSIQAAGIGDAVSLAFRLQGGATESGIFLTQRVVDKIPDSLPYGDAGVVETSTGWQRVWRVDPAATEL